MRSSAAACRPLAPAKGSTSRPRCRSIHARGGEPAGGDAAVAAAARPVSLLLVHARRQPLLPRPPPARRREPAISIARCVTAWNHVRAVCINCGGSRGMALKGIEGDNGAVKAETCDDCRTYVKTLYQAKDTRVDPVADDLATLALDLLWPRQAGHVTRPIPGSPGHSPDLNQEAGGRAIPVARHVFRTARFQQCFHFRQLGTPCATHRARSSRHLRRRGPSRSGHRPDP